MKSISLRNVVPPSPQVTVLECRFTVIHVRSTDSLELCIVSALNTFHVN